MVQHVGLYLRAVGFFWFVFFGLTGSAGLIQQTVEPCGMYESSLTLTGAKVTLNRVPFSLPTSSVLIDVKVYVPTVHNVGKDQKCLIPISPCYMTFKSGL